MSEQAAEKLESCGLRLRRGKSGKVRAACLPPDVTLDATQWQLIGQLEDLVKFEAAGADVRDEQVELLAALPRLSHLDLSRTAITDAALEHLERAGKLQLLHLTGVAVSDDALKRLRQRLLGARIVRA